MTGNRIFPTRLILIIAIVLGKAAVLWPQTTQTPFKFPYQITYTIIKNNQTLGRCLLTYEQDTGKGEYNRQRSTLKLVGFQGLDITPGQILAADIFRDDLSLYLESVDKGQVLISQLKLNEELDFDGKKKQYFVYKEILSNHNFQVTITPKHPCINFLSSFIVTSKIAASGNTSEKKFNYLKEREAKPVTIKHQGSRNQRLNGTLVPLQVLIIKYIKKELFQFEIRKDKDNYWYPQRILFSDRVKNDFELVADTRTIVWDYKPLVNSVSSPGLPPGLPGLPAGCFTVMDPLRQAPVQPGETREWLNQAALRGITMANPAKHRLQVTEFDHNTFNLAAIFLNPNLTKEQKMQRIVDEIMTPNGLEIIVTGFYIQEHENAAITVSPIVIFKYNSEVIPRNLEFQPYEFTCRKPGTGETVLCREALFKISTAIKELLEKY